MQPVSENKYISAQELAEILGISSRAVEKQIANLKDKRLLKRIGPDKGGHWEITDESKNENIDKMSELWKEEKAGTTWVKDWEKSWEKMLYLLKIY